MISLSDDSKINIKFGDIEYSIDLKKSKTDLELYVFSNDLDKIKYDINTNEIFKKNNDLTSLTITLDNVKYIHDDVSVLLPTGLFKDLIILQQVIISWVKTLILGMFTFRINLIIRTLW